jgi:hypothetical protein
VAPDAKWHTKEGNGEKCVDPTREMALDSLLRKDERFADVPDLIKAARIYGGTACFTCASGGWCQF